MLRLLVLIAAQVLPAAAQACPQGLGAGVVVGYDDLSVAHLTPTGAPDVMREWVLFSEDGEGYEVLALHGVYTLRTANFDATGELSNTVEATFYTRTPTRPAPDQHITGIEAEVERQGRRFQRVHELITGPQEAMLIADCLYFGFNAELRIQDPEGGIRVMFHVIPSLEVAILVGSEDEIERQVHRPVSIAAFAGDGAPQAPATLPMALD